MRACLMQIQYFYPLNASNSSSSVKEFLSGFFYWGRYKYTIISSSKTNLTLQLGLQKKRCLSNVLKVALCLTGIAVLVAALYKLTEVVSLSKKKIIVLKPHMRAKNKTPGRVEKVFQQLPSPHQGPLKVLKIHEQEALISREDLEKKLEKDPSINTLSIYRSMALHECLWLADFLHQRPHLCLEFMQRDENIQIKLNEEMFKALKIYITKNQKFAESVFEEFSSLVKQANHPKEAISFFVDLVLYWGQFSLKVSQEKYPSSFIDHLILALTLENDLPYIHELGQTFDQLIHFILCHSKPQQLIHLLDICLCHPLYASAFVRQVSEKQLKLVQEHFEHSKKDDKYMKEMLLKNICTLIESSRICEEAAWEEQKLLLGKFTQIFFITKEKILQIVHDNSLKNRLILSEGLQKILVSLSVMSILNVLDMDDLSEVNKRKGFNIHYEFIKQLNLPDSHVFLGRVLAESDLLEPSQELVLKSLNARAVQAYLETLLKSNNLDQIRRTFSWFLPHRDEVKQTFPGILALIFESIDSPEKALAVYRAHPTEEIKNNLLNGIKKGELLYKINVPRELLETIF